MLIGYARVSKEDQELRMQIDALEKVGCELIFEEKISGKTNDRPKLLEALSHLREGDTLVVWKLDRLGRTTQKLINLINELKERKIDFFSINDNINTTTSYGTFFFHVMAALAQMERDQIVERTRAGLEAAKKRGRIGGRKRKMTNSKIDAAKSLFAQGYLPKDIAENLEISIPTLYRWIPAKEQEILAINTNNDKS
jgi:DNA invertase Pin-like site-specific DNA recombinase